MRALFFSSGIMALLATTGFTQTAPSNPALDETRVSVPSLPESTAQIFTLPNGLTIIVDEDHSAPVASVQAWCETGSIDEGKWMGAGLSHILEHMLFKGTDTRPPGSIARQVQDRGGYINAYTSFDRTVYYIDTPAEGASEAVDILADVMVNATLPPEEYEKEQEVIRREFAMGFDDPDRVSSKLMFATVFSQSPYRHPVIGYLDIYNKLTREDVLAYYRERYVPNNMFFVIVGDVDTQAVRSQLESFFEKHPRKALAPVYVPHEPPQVGARRVEEEFPTKLTRLSLAWPLPPITSPDTPALDVLGYVLGGGASSPLNQEIREKKRLAFQIGSGSYALDDGGLFAIQAICEPDKRGEVEKESLAILQDVQTNGISDGAIDKARNALLAGQLGALTTVRGRAADLGSNWLYARNLNFSRDYLEAVNRVTAADVQRVANQYLTPERLNVISLNPTGTLAREKAAAPEARDLEIKKYTLPNGLRLLVRENPKVPLVSMSAVFKGALLAETPETNGITAVMARAMTKGTSSRTAREIAETIEGVGGSIDSNSGNNSFSISVGVMKPYLALGIDLLADVVKNPSFPEAEIETEKAAQIAAIDADADEPMSVARDLLRANLFTGHPYAMKSLGSPEAIGRLDAAQLRAMHDRVVTGKNGVITVFGDVNAEEVFELVSKAFGDLPAGDGSLPDPAPGAAPAEPKSIAESRDMSQAVVMIGYPGVNMHSPDRVAVELIDTASSDLGSRFFDSIREKLGLAYFVGSTQFMGPESGGFVFYLGTDPAKAEKVRSVFKDEIAKLAAEGLTPEELARAKKKLLGAEAIRNQSDAAMAQVVALDELFGLGADYHRKRREQIEAATLEQTREAAKKYFDTPGSVEVVVAPGSEPNPS
jgi:Predicted Zn-dependent peptidases